MPTKNYHLLIVDDDPQFHQQMRYDFRRHYTFDGAIGVQQLEKKLESGEAYDLVLLDLVFDNRTQEKIGLRLLPEIIERLPKTPIIVVTNDREVSTVVEAMNNGAKSFLHKEQYDFDKWNNTFTEIIESVKLKRENKKLRKELTKVKKQYEYTNPEECPLIGSSAAMERLRKTLKLLATEEDLTVLITGETGVGKGVAARFLHHNSNVRREKAFEEIHISNIPKTLLESTLFGAKKGTFTGAVRDMKGRLHMADEGIVFLDEIGDLDLENQVKLLQFIQKKTIRPIGTSKDIQLDVQIVAATNKVLREEVAKGNFREDLYQRLKVFPIEIPPLRERREDITELMLYFVELKEEEELESLFERSTLQFLQQQYDWVGNVRELENAIKSVNIKRKVLGLEKANMKCLPDDMQERSSSITIPVNSQLHTHSEITSEDVNKPAEWSVEKQNAWNTLRAIEQALIKTNGVKKDAAKLLNYNSTDQIRYKVNSTHEKFPHLLRDFPAICEKYKIQP